MPRAKKPKPAPPPADPAIRLGDRTIRPTDLYMLLKHCDPAGPEAYRLREVVGRFCDCEPPLSLVVHWDSDDETWVDNPLWQAWPLQEWAIHHRKWEWASGIGIVRASKLIVDASLELPGGGASPPEALSVRRDRLSRCRVRLAIADRRPPPYPPALDYVLEVLAAACGAAPDAGLVEAALAAIRAHKAGRAVEPRDDLPLCDWIAEHSEIAWARPIAVIEAACRLAVCEEYG